MLLVIAYTGGITLFVAATIAVVMTDIKKVLAYSTVSQLGYMMLALGVGGWVAGLFHLLTHAFFKALLFLCSGSVIYGCHHEQDMRKMGGLFPKMKITALTMLVGVLAIAGMPLFSGWYSKDAILAQALGFINVHPQHLLLFLLPLVTAGITAFYMFRMWFMTFTGKPRDHHVYEHAHESPWLMTVPLIVLAVLQRRRRLGLAGVGRRGELSGARTLHHAQHAGRRRGLRHDELANTGQAPRFDWHERASLAVEYHGWPAPRPRPGAVGIVFAALIYYYRVLDPAEARRAVPRRATAS